MLINTKYSPPESINGEPLMCTSDTTLKPEQLLMVLTRVRKRTL